MKLIRCFLMLSLVAILAFVPFCQAAGAAEYRAVPSVESAKKSGTVMDVYAVVAAIETRCRQSNEAVADNVEPIDRVNFIQISNVSGGRFGGGLSLGTRCS